jgi:metal-responsive CopG/Arc/MetJ family transcriptional regulator
MEEQVNVRFNSKLLDLVDKAIDNLGIANDRSEFIRMAVAEKLERLGLFGGGGREK